MRYFFGFVAFLAALGMSWSWAVGHDGLLRYCDGHVKSKAAPVILSWLGEWYEVADDHEKMQGGSQRILERYPDSPYAEEAQFRVALALEKMNKIPDAIEQYGKYLDKYPQGTYNRSVRKNVEILKSR
jgi:TolA-binding protein